MAVVKLPRVFLTGAAGYIGSHILDQLLMVCFQITSTDYTKADRCSIKSKKYHITAALRSSQRITEVLELHPEYQSSPLISFIIIPDLAIPASCDAILAGDEFDYIIHTAGEFRFDGPDISKDIVEPSLDAFVAPPSPNSVIH